MRPWMAAVQAAAQQAALAEDRARQGWAATDPRLPTFAYRWEHVQLVARNGAWLLTQQPQADGEVLLAACWLHDVCKQQPQHAARGADFARDFLPTTDFPAHKMARVAEAIAQHEGLTRPAVGWDEASGEPFRAAPPLQPLEAALLWDADKLAKVGPVAFVHFLPYFLFERLQQGESTTTADIQRRNQRWLDEIAPRILASFNSAPAQRRARQLQASYDQFWQSAALALDP